MIKIIDEIVVEGQDVLLRKDQDYSIHKDDYELNDYIFGDGNIHELGTTVVKSNQLYDFLETNFNSDKFTKLLERYYLNNYESEMLTIQDSDPNVVYEIVGEETIDKLTGIAYEYERLLMEYQILRADQGVELILDDSELPYINLDSFNVNIGSGLEVHVRLGDKKVVRNLHYNSKSLLLAPADGLELNIKDSILFIRPIDININDYFIEKVIVI